MTLRRETLDLAILGELDQPAHGYELRRRLVDSLGALRTLSFGSLYPALHRLAAAGLIEASTPTLAPPATDRASRGRRRIRYRLTAAGVAHFQQAMRAVDVDDDSFPVAIHLLGKVPPAIRLRVLRARRAQVVARREARRAAARAGATGEDLARARARFDLEQAEREVTWLDRVIERLAPSASAPAPAPKTSRRATRRATHTKGQ